jgi:aminopeptidase N
MLGIFSCGEEKKVDSYVELEVNDSHSFSNPREISVSHVYLNLKVDFDSTRLEGTASLTIQHNKPADTLWLDTRGLEISFVTLDNASEKINIFLGNDVIFKGKPLGVPIKQTTKTVNVNYRTTDKSVALQWLNPEQTAVVLSEVTSFFNARCNRLIRSLFIELLYSEHLLNIIEQNPP